MSETRVDAAGDTRVDDSGNTRITRSGAALSDSTLELLDASVGAGHRDGSRQVVYVLRGSPMSLVESALEDLYFASTTFRTDATDTPANTPMLGRLVPPNVRVTILKGNAIRRSTSSTRGTIKVYNESGLHFDRNEVLTESRGRYDGLRRDYSWQGRKGQMFIGPEDGAFATEFDAFFPFLIQDFDWDVNQILFVPGPALVEADDQVQKDFYGQGYTVVTYEDGDGGGGAVGINPNPPDTTGTITSFDDLSGVPKPLAYGRIFGLPPQEISSINEIHQFHTGAEVDSGHTVESLDVVYEDGLGMTPGTDYSEDLAACTYTLVSPSTAIMTADVHGAKAGPSGTYIDRPADILQAVLVQRVGLETADIDSATFALYDAEFPYECGFYFGAERISRNKFIESMLAPVGFLFRGRDGLIRLGYIKNPSEETATLQLSEKDIKDVVRKATLPPVWRVRLGYAPIEKPINLSSFAGAVTEAEKTRQSQAYRWVEAKDEGLLEFHQAVELEIETRFSNQADAQALADYVLTLYGKQRDILEVKLTNKFMRYDMGDIVQVQWPRYDLVDDGEILMETGDTILLETGDALLKEEDADGTNFMCVGYVDNPASNDFTVTVWG